MNDYVVVDTFCGKLCGKLLTDINGEGFYGFQGIPYAKPPVGSLRFKAPLPPDKWPGVRDATLESKECYQRHMIFQTIIGSEDCLYLNVYTPQLPSDGESLKPVMVWIHGGAFTGGSGKTDLYGPEILVAEDVVVVTINYRIGILGFLSIEDPEVDVPGNAGLKDMVLALQWVQQNIKQFNGDPKNVTVFGESAGAVSAHLLMLSPLSKGLFHKAIAQSGCALTHWSVTESSTKKLCQLLNFSSDYAKDILTYLQELPVEKLYLGQELLQNFFGISRNRPIGPVIEKENPGAFLTEDPHKIIAEGRYYKVPFIIGYNNREGIFFDLVENRMKTTMMVTDFEIIVPKRLNFEKGSEKSKEVANKIREFYYRNEEITVENKDIYYQLETDVVFLQGVYETVRLHRETSRMPVYVYRFSVDAKLNLFKTIGNLTAPGASHGDEMGYQFKTLLTPKEINMNTAEGKTIYRMSKLWTNFAKTGNPNPETHDELINVIWEPIKQTEINFLDIGFDLVADINPDYERIRFWDRITQEYGRTSDP